MEHIVHVLVADTGQVLDKLEGQKLASRMLASQPFLDDGDVVFGSASQETLRAGSRVHRESNAFEEIELGVQDHRVRGFV